MKYFVVVSAILLVACRTIWVHPEATALKYDEDMHFCQRGVERPDPISGVVTERSGAADREWALEATSPGGEVRRGWKRCMVRLGWDTSYSARSQRPWRTPEEKPLKGR